MRSSICDHFICDCIIFQTNTKTSASFSIINNKIKLHLEPTIEQAIVIILPQISSTKWLCKPNRHFPAIMSRMILKTIPSPPNFLCRLATSSSSPEMLCIPSTYRTWQFVVALASPEMPWFGFWLGKILFYLSSPWKKW